MSRRDPGRHDFALVVGETVERGRCEADRQPAGRPQDRRREVDRRDVHEHPGTEPVTPEGSLVVGQGDLVPRTAGVVGERLGRERCLRQGFEVGREGFVIPREGDRDARDSGQFGAALRWLDGETEYGAYFMNYHSRTPFINTHTADAATFAALGLAVSGLIPHAHAAPAVVNAIVLPLYVISDVLIPIDAGSPVATIAGLFPVRHLAVALQSVWQPTTAPLDLADLAWLVAWGVLGTVVALRTFDWEPRG